MRDEYRIMKVESVQGRPEFDLVMPSEIYTIKRRADGVLFRVRLPKDDAWQPGEVVRIEPFHIQAALVS